MAASCGTACGASSLAGCLRLPSVIPTPCAAWASSPKARAGCGNPACPDPWRGLCANMIPTPALRIDLTDSSSGKYSVGDSERQIDDLDPLVGVDDAFAPDGVEIGEWLFRDGFLGELSRGLQFLDGIARGPLCCRAGRAPQRSWCNCRRAREFCRRRQSCP